MVMARDQKMIIARKSIKSYIKAHPSVETFAQKFSVTRQTIYNILDDMNVSSDMISKLLQETGFDFEKAFEVKEDK